MTITLQALSIVGRPPPEPLLWYVAACAMIGGPILFTLWFWDDVALDVELTPQWQARLARLRACFRR